MGSTAHLVPFNSDTAKTAAARSAEVRQAKKLARTNDSATAAQRLDELVQAHERHKLGPICAAAAAWLVDRITSGAIRVRSDDAAALLRAFIDIARLEAGEATSHALTAHMSTRDALAYIDELRERAQSTLVASATTGLSAAAVAVADAIPGDVVEGAPTREPMPGDES